jgi:acyl-CoA synthetase (NDP forming)
LTGKQIIQGARAEGRAILTEKESKDLIKGKGILVNETELARSRDEAISLGKQFGFPVVLKIASPDIVHKTDAGGVKLHLKMPEEVGEAYDDILDSVSGKFPEARIQGVTVQKAARLGVEVIVGMFKDVQFGPVLMFGLGGILVEILKDVSFRIIPLNSHDAASMIREIKGYPLLEGYRGSEAVDISRLEALLLDVSEFIQHYPEIKELDLNPVFAYKDSWGKPGKTNTNGKWCPRKRRCRW